MTTLCSIGRPWQSQPGTYGLSNPAIVSERTTRSLSTLLSKVPHVDLAVGVRRAVVQDLAWPAGARLAELVVKILLAPPGLDLRLADRSGSPSCRSGSTGRLSVSL